jgi:hypothetical protein
VNHPHGRGALGALNSLIFQFTPDAFALVGRIGRESATNHAAGMSTAGQIFEPDQIAAR